MLVVPLSFDSPLRAEHTMTTLLVLIYVLEQNSYKTAGSMSDPIHAYGIMVSAISFKNLPTLVPPYFCTIHGRWVGFDMSDNCIMDSE